MDETLIHCNANLNVPSDFIIDLQFPTGERISVSEGGGDHACLTWCILSPTGWYKCTSIRGGDVE